jgi:hypothetical protein
LCRGARLEISTSSRRALRPSFDTALARHAFSDRPRRPAQTLALISAMPYSISSSLNAGSRTEIHEQRLMKPATIFLQLVIVLIGIGALAVLLWEPHIEGRNAHATLFEIYFEDPFLAYAYIASIPFFVALYQGFKVVGYAGKNQTFSPEAVKALRTIKFCAIAIIGFVCLGEIFIMLGDSDDRAGGVFMGMLFISGSAVVAAAAMVLERILQDGVDLKSTTPSPR